MTAKRSTTLVIRCLGTKRDGTQCARRVRFDPNDHRGHTEACRPHRRDMPEHDPRVEHEPGRWMPGCERCRRQSIWQKVLLGTLGVSLPR